MGSQRRLFEPDDEDGSTGDANRTARWDETWNRRYAELLLFKDQVGHCNVPTQSDELGGLGTWVSSQRRKYKQGKLNRARTELLNEIGFEWELRPSAYRRPRRDWEEMFQKLESVQAEFGHCNVPYRWVEDPAFGKWVHSQRKSRLDGKLTEGQITRLDDLGFELNVAMVRWKEKHAEVMEFIDIHRYSGIPDSADYRRLYTWVTSQRLKLRRGELDDEQARLLDAVDF